MNNNIALLNNIYLNEVKGYLDQIDRLNSVMANYFKSMIHVLGDNPTEEEIKEESYNYAWNLEPWTYDITEDNLFIVYDFYVEYFKLSKEDRLLVRNEYLFSN